MAELNIAINAAQAVSGAKKVTSALASIAAKSRSLIPSISPLNAAIGALGSSVAIKGLISTADTYTTLAAQLTYVTGSAVEAEEAQEKLFKMSQQTGTAMTTNAEALVRLSQANEMTNLTTTENIKILGGLNALMLKTGTTGVSAASAMTQLTQALASGVLAGDEFKTINENAPALMKAFAESLGVGVGEMKALAAEGKITTDVMVGALQKIADEGEASFDSLPKTAESGWTRVVNAFQKAWDQINDENGILAYIFNGLVSLADWIVENTPVFSAWIKDMVDKIRANWPDIKAGFGSMFTVMSDLVNYILANGPIFANFAGNVINAFGAIKSNLAPIFSWLWDKMKWLGKVVAGIGAMAGAVSAGDYTGAMEAFKGGYSSNMVTDLEQQSAENTQAAGGTTVINNFNQNISKSDVEDISNRMAIAGARS